jgi:nitroreductase
METLKAIHTRRSIRKFTADPVSDADIRELLAAAMAAPSAGNEQPWQFVVVTDRALLAEVPKIHPYAAMASSAPLAILVRGDLSLEKYGGLWVQDCSAATENLLLAAHDRGLGAVWTAVYPDEGRVKAFRKLFGLPERITPFAFVVIGRPAQEPRHEDRYLEDRVHRNGWARR